MQGKTVGRRHHWVAAGKIFFSIPNPNEEDADRRMYGDITLNAMTTAQHNYINGPRLGQIQQALQLRAVEKIGNPDIKFEDVVVLNISYLGHMTDAEFNPPEEIKPSIHERAPLAS